MNIVTPKVNHDIVHLPCTIIILQFSNQWKKSYWIQCDFHHWKLITNYKIGFSTNQCISIILTFAHFPFDHVMGKCIENVALTIVLTIHPFSHFNQSMFLHVTWGKFASSCLGESLNIGHLPILPFQSINAFSCHMKKIGLFMSWGISHHPSYWPSSHLTFKHPS